MGDYCRTEKIKSGDGIIAKIVCDICDKPVKGGVVYAVDQCSIPKKGGLEIEETLEVCPECMESNAKNILAKYVGVSK